MLLAPGGTLTILVIAVLSALLLGLLVVQLVGVPLGSRARYAIGGGTGLLVGLGFLILVLDRSWPPKAVANATESLIAGPVSITIACLLVAIVFVGLTIAIAEPSEWHLTDRVAPFLVTLLAAGFFIFPAVPGLLPIGDPNLAKTASLSMAQSGLPLLALSGALIGWRPLSTYRLGLFIVGGSLLMDFSTFITLHQLAADLGGPVAILGIPVGALLRVLIFVGAAMTLYANLWHPAQWAAAGAGVAAVVTSLVMPITDPFVGGALFFGGMLAVMVVPRLIGSYVKARQAQ